MTKNDKKWCNNNNDYDSNGISNNNYLLILFINFAIQHQSK